MFGGGYLKVVSVFQGSTADEQRNNCVDNKVHLTAEYENFKDNVTIDEASTYFRDLNKYDEIASFEISLGGEEETSSNSKTGNKNIVSTILLLGIISGGLIWWNKRK